MDRISDHDLSRVSIKLGRGVQNNRYGTKKSPQSSPTSAPSTQTLPSDMKETDSVGQSFDNDDDWESHSSFDTGCSSDLSEYENEIGEVGELVDGGTAWHRVSTSTAARYKARSSSVTVGRYLSTSVAPEYVPRFNAVSQPAWNISASAASERVARSRSDAFRRNLEDFLERQTKIESLPSPFSCQQPRRPTTAYGAYRPGIPVSESPLRTPQSKPALPIAQAAFITSPLTAKKGFWTRVKDFMGKKKKAQMKKENERLREMGRPIPSKLFVPDESLMGTPTSSPFHTPSPKPTPLTPQQRFPLLTPPSGIFNAGRPRGE